MLTMVSTVVAGKEQNAKWSTSHQPCIFLQETAEEKMAHYASSTQFSYAKTENPLLPTTGNQLLQTMHKVTLC